MKGSDSAQVFYICNAAYAMSTSFIKISLFFQYIRFFEPGTFLRRVCIFLVVFVGFWGLAYSFMAFFPCFPVWAYWNLDANATCYGYGSQIPSIFLATYESHTAVNMCLDVLTLAVPIPLYFKPGTNSKTRVRLFLLLLMGGV